MSLDDKDLPTPISELSEEKRLAQFKEWLKLSSEAFAEQRRLEKLDLECQNPENIWTSQAKEARKGRPMISISLTQGPLQHVYNQAAAAHFGIDVKPVSENAHSKLADVKKGMFARIQRDGGAHHARMWGFDRASQVGMGWYRIGTQWDEDSDNPSDQEIVYLRILHQDMVYPDPAATRQDFSDGRFLIYGAHIPLKDFKRQFPKAKINQQSDFDGLVSTEPEWVDVDRDKAPLVAEVFYVNTVTEVIQLEAKGGKYERIHERPEVRRAVCTAFEIFEDEPWLPDSEGVARQYIPFVPVIAVERQPVNGKRLWEGMTRSTIGAQRTFMYSISQAVEDVSSSSKAKYLVQAGQIEGFEKYWDEMNLVNRPYLPYNPTNVKGEPAPPPQIMQIDGTKMQLSLALAQQARELVQTATQGYEPLEVPKRAAEQSGRAILALEQKADAGRSHYIQNFKDISLPLDARIVMDMMPVVYDRPGRVLHILGMEDETKPVMLNKPYIVQDGQPVAVPEGTEGAEEPINLAEGKYAIIPTMGKAPQTRLQEGQEFMAEVLKAAPDMLQVMGDLAFQYRDEPGAKEIAERLKRQIQQNAPHLLEKQDGNDAEKIKAENQALKAQLQLVTQQAGEMAKVIETDQAKQQAQIETAKIKSQEAITIAQMNNAAKIQIARIQSQWDRENLEAEAQEERLATGLKIAHEREMKHEEMAHEVALKAAEAQTMNVTREEGREQDSEEGTEEGAATLPPEPVVEGEA